MLLVKIYVVHNLSSLKKLKHTFKTLKYGHNNEIDFSQL